MRNGNINGKKSTWRRWVMGASIAAAAALLAVITLTPQAPGGEATGSEGEAWYSCFEDLGEGFSLGADPEAVLVSVRHDYEEAERLERMHRTALAQLSRDPRWSDPEQVESLNQAVADTMGFLEEMDQKEEQAMTTMGCLEEH